MKNKEVKYRLAVLGDSSDIAKLHVQNWQTTYRGSWSDNFLDNIAPQKQLDIWTKRLNSPNSNQHILFAEAESQLIGFACTELNKNKTYGALLDNLHVDADWRGHGIGKQLTLASTDWVKSKNPKSPYYLWVLENNHSARIFYKKLGGKEVETVVDSSEEMGAFSLVRCVWEIGF